MKNTKLFNLHTFTVFSYLVFFSILAMTFTHPLYLAFLFAAVFFLIVVFKGIKKWKGYLFLSLVMAFFIVIVNILVSKNGQTILYHSSVIPLLGEIVVTKESVLYGMNIGLKLTLIISAFYLFELMLERDRTFSFFSRFFPKSTVLVVLTSSMIPQMRRKLKDISIVLKMRGAGLPGSGIRKRIMSSYPLLKVLLLTSLEGSWETAEVLNARAFGSGRRTHYSGEGFGVTDLLVFIGITISLAGFAAVLFNKEGFLTFYPEVQNILDSYSPLLAATIAGGLLVLPLIKVIKRNETV